MSVPTRHFTNEILRRVDAGDVTADEVLFEILLWLPEATVAEFAQTADLLSGLFEEEVDANV